MKNNINFVSIDVETGGLDENIHPLLEVGMVAIIDGKTIKELDFKVRHESYNMTPIAQNVNGIYNLLEHEKNALTAKEALEAIKTYAIEMRNLNNGLKLMPMGHNVQFDVRFLKKLFRDLNDNFENYFDYHLFDLNTMMMTLYSIGLINELPSNSDKASQVLGLPLEVKPHRAINGARHNIEVYLKASQLFDEQKETYIKQLKL